MAHRRRGSRPPRPQPSREGELSLTELERFSELSLRQWNESSSTLRTLQTELFFGLELARQQHTADLIEAIRSKCVAGEYFEHWARIVDFRYCLAPLSVAGSLKGDGGRFNIGAGLNPAAFASFPALYIAEDYPTAYREKFGAAPEDAGHAQHAHKLNSSELALRSPGSFTHVALRGRLELVLDIGELSAIQPFAQVLQKFALPERVRRLSRKLALRSPPTLVRTAAGLQRQLLSPHWRINPVQFGLPSNSQVFGRIAAAAGVHGIRYPSVRQSKAFCMVLFPQNWKSSASFVEVRDGAPSQACQIRIDGTTSTFQ